ncbi:MAG TPA: acyl carrier protein [Aestuariivirga sp.]|nr:acyl carrier protein [Aestuariivirga sp.]
MTDTVAQICELLQSFNTNGTALKPETDISTDLNIDSVTVMDFVMEVEDRFDIEIPLNMLSETRTIAELAQVVEARVKKARP